MLWERIATRRKERDRKKDVADEDGEMFAGNSLLVSRCTHCCTKVPSNVWAGVSGGLNLHARMPAFSRIDKLRIRQPCLCTLSWTGKDAKLSLFAQLYPAYHSPFSRAGGGLSVVLAVSGYNRALLAQGSPMLRTTMTTSSGGEQDWHPGREVHLHLRLRARLKRIRIVAEFSFFQGRIPKNATGSRPSALRCAK